VSFEGFQTKQDNKGTMVVGMLCWLQLWDSKQVTSKQKGKTDLAEAVLGENSFSLKNMT
jgi:DNA-binding transcriptional regulator/RsmH inhibitor MraZ